MARNRLEDLLNRFITKQPSVYICVYLFIIQYSSLDNAQKQRIAFMANYFRHTLLAYTKVIEIFRVPLKTRSYNYPNICICKYSIYIYIYLHKQYKQIFHVNI